MKPIPSPVIDITEPTLTCIEQTYRKEASPNNVIDVDIVAPGKYKWNKKHYCPICNKNVIKMARHLQQMHEEEIEVKRATSYPSNSRQRKECFDSLRNRGNFIHNQTVVKLGKGTILPKRRSRNNHLCADSYTPCFHCKQFFKKTILWSHERKCKQNLEKARSRKVLMRSSMIISEESEDPTLKTSFTEKILYGMICDEVTKSAVSDPLIIKLGETLFKKVNKPHSVNYVRQRMRQTARLLNKIKEFDSSIEKLQDALKPSKFDLIVKAVKECSKFDETSGMYTTAGLALKIGYNLDKCSLILISNAIKVGNRNLQEETENFMRLKESQWAEEISSKALFTLEERHYNKSVSLPIVEDIKKLNEYVSHELTTHIDKLKQGNLSSYIELSKYVLVSLIFFNRKRAGEAQRITVDNFVQGCSTSLNEDVRKSLSPVEQALVTQLKMIEIRGKRGRKVPLLLRPIHYDAITLLLSQRLNATTVTFMYLLEQV